MDRLVRFLQSWLWRSSTLVSKRSEIFLSVFLRVILLTHCCHTELSTIISIFDRSMDPLKPTQNFTTQEAQDIETEVAQSMPPTTTDKCIHSPTFLKIVPYKNKANLVFSALTAKKDGIFFEKVIGVV